MISALFTTLGFQLALLGTSVLVTYGITVLLVGNLTSKNYTFLLSSILLPPIAILCISAFGFFSPNQSSLRVFLFFLGAGAFLTIFMLAVGFREWRSSGRPTFSWPLVFGICGMVSHDFFNATSAFSYNYQGNGEFLNYAKLAAFMMGSGHSDFGGDFVQHHRSLRYGQDIWLGLIANIFNRHPIELVHICGGYLRFAYGVAFGIIACSVFREKKPLIVILTLYSVSVVELFSFNASFLSSNIYVPYAMLWGAALVYFGKIDDGSNKQLVLNLITFLAFYVFGALTYPELHAVAITFLFGYLAVGAITGCYPLSEFRRLFVGLFAPLVVLAILNWHLLAKLLNVAVGQAGSGGGWNIFSSPKSSLVEYLSFILGLKFRLGTNEALLPKSLNFIAVVYASLVFLLGALAILLKRNRFSCIFGLWILAILAVNVAAGISGSYYYAAAKLVLQTNFMILIAFGVALFEAPRPLMAFPKMGGAIGQLKRVLLGSYVLFVCFLFVDSIEHSLTKSRAYNLSQWSEILRSQGAVEGFAVVGDTEGEGIWFADLAAAFSGTQVIPLSDFQLDRLERRGSNKPCRGSEIRLIDRDYKKSVKYVVLPNARNRDGFYYLGDQSGAYFERAFFGREIGLSGDISFFYREGSSLVAYRWLDTELMVDRLWSACITVPRKTVNLEFNVPSETFSGHLGVHFILKEDGYKLGELAVERPGIYRIDGAARSEIGEMRLTLESLAYGVPSKFVNSPDPGKPSTSIMSLTLE